jgi:NAD(P)-dependent dehydrogenase (short-subunit alcohol dehydrogenase family)
MTALVTGAGKRLGRAMALYLAQRGHDVAVHYASSQDEAEAVVAEIRAMGRKAQAFQADLLDEAQVQALVPSVTDALGQMTVLVNNASIFEYDTAKNATDETWARHLQINLSAPVFLARAFAAAAQTLPEGETACIVNLLDNKVFATNPDYFSYTISKQALEGATRTLALALAPKVRVCGIAPGIALISGKQTEADFQRTHRNNPLKRGCTPDDIARAIRFILETPSMTGHTIVIDGGQYLARMPRDVAFL